LSFFKDILPAAGGILGSAFGPVGAAVGSGIGSLLAGGDPKDAIVSGIMSGAGAKLFPGVGTSVAGATGMGSEEVLKQAALKEAAKKQVAEKAVAETVAKEAAKKTAEQGIMSGLGGKMYLAGSLAGLLEEPEQINGGDFSPSDLEANPNYRGEAVGGLFTNPYTGESFDTAEEYRESMARGPVRTMAEGGYIEGPGTGRSDDVDAGIFQDGVKVQEAKLSDGEFVMTERAVRGLGNGDRSKGAAKMYEMMRQYERMA